MTNNNHQPKPVKCRGVRGAVIANENTREAILDATRDLLRQIIEANQIDQTDVTSVIFTMTPDLNAEFPALAARQLGWVKVPLLCAQEIAKPGSLPQVIRILMHWNTTRTQHEINHIYIGGAEVLRPDVVNGINAFTHHNEGADQQ